VKILLLETNKRLVRKARPIKETVKAIFFETPTIENG